MCASIRNRVHDRFLQTHRQPWLRVQQSGHHVGSDTDRRLYPWNLLDGKKIELGDLGAFYISLSSKGTLTAEEFNPNIHIKNVKVIWSPGSDFKNILGSASFNLVSNRRAQRLLLKAVTSEDTTVDLSKEEENNDGFEE